MCAGVLLACVSVHHIRAVNVEDKRDIGQPGTGTAAGFEVSCGCLRSNPGHPEEQPVIFPADPPVVLFLRQDLSLASEAGQQTPGICVSLAHLRLLGLQAQMCSSMRGQLLKLRGLLWRRRKALGENS